MCKCNKGLPANKSPIISGAFAVNNGALRYTNNDFIVKYYIGETGNYIGSSTGIDYGLRTYNSKTMVHASDYEVDSQLFSDSESLEQEVQSKSETRGRMSEQIDSLESAIYEMANSTEFGTTSTGDNVADYTINGNVEQQNAEKIKLDKQVSKTTRAKPKKETENVENTV